jgi:hypothetical protein
MIHVPSTSENHLARLKSTNDAEDFKKLDGVWLSNLGFDGSYTAEELLTSGCPTPGALSTYVVFQAALHFGVRPQGIVSDATTRAREYVTKVAGTRVYVGISLPFEERVKSEFSVEPADRVWYTPAAGAAGDHDDDHDDDDDEDATM